MKGKENPLLIATYVDDLVIASRNDRDVMNIQDELGERLKIKRLGDINYLLGWKITVEDEAVRISQPSYIQQILLKFDMRGCNPAPTPADPGQAKKLNNKSDDEVSFPYRECVGSLMWLANSTRPDIAYAVHRAARFVSKPNQDNVNSLKRILRYLQGSSDVGIIFKKSGYFKIIGYADADFAGHTGESYSTSGSIFFTNGPVSWTSTRQKLTALSTTEAEINALADAAKEAFWLLNMCQDANLLPNNTKVTLKEDNVACYEIVTGSQVVSPDKARGR